MASTLTSNMNLIVPTVGLELSPTWAEDLNNDLSLIDAHDHTPGYGVAITPSGLNINADLSLGNNNLINSRSLRLDQQSAVLSAGADLSCLYDVNGDLYYNDGAGNNIQITQSGGIAGSPGSISNLTSPASASYVSADQTFVWQSDANVSADMDMGSIILRNLTASSHGITIAPPNSLGSNFTLTLPTGLPGSTRPLTLSSSGAIAAQSLAGDGLTQNSDGTLKVGVGQIVNSMIANTTTSTGTSSGAFQTVTAGNNAFCTVDAVASGGKTTLIIAQPDGSANDCYIAGKDVIARIYRNSTLVYQAVLGTNTTTSVTFPPSCISFYDIAVGSGTRTYTLKLQSASGTGGIAYVALSAIELT